MPTRPVRRRMRRPWYLFFAAISVAIGVAMPLCYLLVRGFDAQASELSAMLLRWRNVHLLINTVTLAAAVLAVSSTLAFIVAWLTTRSDLPCRQFWLVLCVLPLAIPPYLMAYAYKGIGGNVGTMALLTGWPGPHFSGFVGALLALSLYNMPLMLLNFRVGIMRLDPTLEDVARSLGRSRRNVLWHVILPQLKPAFLAGALLVTLNVIGDFGVVSLMRYETFSYALFQLYEVGERVYAAWIAVALLGLTVIVLIIDAWVLHGLTLQGRAQRAPKPRKHDMGVWRYVAMLFLIVLILAALLAPLSTFIYWAIQQPTMVADAAYHRRELFEALRGSLIASVPAALLAAGLATPVAFLSRRYPSAFSRSTERMAYLGYATPCLAFALGLTFFALRFDEAFGIPINSGLYQSLGLLVYAYSLHYLAEAVGPIRATLFVATPRLEEASRSLGCGPLRTFMRVTFPVLRSGLAVSVALVFLSAMKELPLTILLAPIGFSTLAINAFNYAQEAMFIEAAPYALAIVAFSAMLVGLVLWRGEKNI